MRVAVGTALTGRPPRRSGRADFPHPAPRSGRRGTCGAVCHSAYDTRFPGPASGVWKLANGIALAPPPSLHSLHPSSRWFVRELLWYYAAVRLPGCVHRRRTVTPFPTRSALDCSTSVGCSMTDTPRLSRFPRTTRLCMPRSATPPSASIPCQSGTVAVAFRALGPRRHSEVAPLFRGSILGLHISCQRFTDGITVVRA
jgi:hypothetical protein